ncbi:TonB-dependent receptor [Pseudoxanthomonas sp. Root630]|uniref:TonB-dependent receptor n=1 Tax=Pseudoxanthomonas sp. Root630 TaxID=1736574 RepID=UPI0007038A33|nr:TonB-dependent receptor [Pseudoxanthomonas sp. Root630]KRA44488.1 TonB-dependent receptor [Pseudoxanthomonas sp. Root630]
MSLSSCASLRASRLSVAVAAALSFPFLAHAADSIVLPDGSRATQLDTVEVKGRKAGLEQAAGTGTRLSLSVMETPASVTVIDRDTLEARGVRTTQEALAGIPGLTVASPPGNGNAVTYRGFSGSQITQLFNGIDVQYASIAARPVDAWQYERVEAIGGPSSFLYGAGAVGGTLNYVTRLARLDRDEAAVQAAWGSFHDGTLAMGANLRIGGDDARQAIRLDASARDGESWVDGQAREASTVAASWLVQLAPTLRHTLAVESQREEDHRPYWGTPVRQPASGRLSVLPETVGRNYNVADGHYGQDVLWARSLLEWTPGERDTVRNTVYHYDALRDYRNVESYRLAPGNDGVIRSGALLQRHDQQLYGNRLEWIHEGMLFGLPTQWATGLDASYNRQTRFPLSLSATVDTVPLAAVTPGQFLDVPGASLVHTPDRTNRLHTQAAYMESLTRLTPSLSLLTGLRRDRIVLDVANHRAVTATNPARFERTYTPTTGRAALNWALTPQASVYAQYSTAADPPAGILSTANFATLRDFDLTTGRQGEIGTKLQSRDGRSFATLAAYRIVRRNVAITDPANPGQTLPVGRQSARGVEASFGWRPSEAITVEGNLAWVDATLDDFFENVGGSPVSRAGNRPANTPSRVGNVWVDYAFGPRWSAGIDLRGVSSRYANAANTLSTAGYATWGAHLDFAWNDSTDLSVRGRNLGDRTHVVYALGSTMVYLGDPRSWEVVLRKRF